MPYYKFRDSVTGEVIIITAKDLGAAMVEASNMSPTFVFEPTK